MALILYLFFFMTLTTLINVDATKKCNLIEHKSPYLRLARHLFCDYDPSERPVKNIKNTTALSITLFPKIMRLDDDFNIMNLHTWLYITWNDEYLQWEKTDFDGVDVLPVLSHDIWTPDIYFGNSANADNFPVDISNNNCLVWHSGEIFCIPRVVLSSKCDIDYTYWPLDNPRCKMEFSLWSHGNNEIKFADNAMTIIMDHFIAEAEMTMFAIDSLYIDNQSKLKTYGEFPTVVIYFSVVRDRSALWSVFGTPTLIIAAMTLTVLLLNPKSTECLMIACVNFFCHLLLYGSIHWFVPQGATVPNIMLFYQNSIMLATTAFISIFIFKKIIDAKSTPPRWITYLLSLILSSKLGRILSMSIFDPKVTARLEDADDNSVLVNRETPKKFTWITVAIILRSLSFISFLLTYIALFVVYLRVPNWMKR